MLAVIDIGTNKIVVLAADFTNEDEFKICASANQKSKGMRKGLVINIEQMAASIKRAVEDAELVLDTRIDSVYVGISGAHIHGHLSDGAASIYDGEVSQYDISNAIATAKTTHIVNNQEVLHTFPREFRVDGESEIREPEGMAGRRLEATVYMVTGNQYQIRNIRKCLELCGLKIKALVFEPVASAMAVLTADERELGICMLDIGGGTTDMAIYTKGEIVGSTIIPVAGDHVSNDIAKILRTPPSYAEDLKLKYGCIQSRIKNSNDTIAVHSLSDDRPAMMCARQTLAQIIEARYTEIFNFAAKYLHTFFDQDMVGGIVLTGGGSKLDGVDELASNIFSVPVRVGSPRQTKDTRDILNDPIYATGFGLLLYARDLCLHDEANKSQSNRLEATFLKIKRWLESHY